MFNVHCGISAIFLIIISALSQELFTLPCTITWSKSTYLMDITINIITIKIPITCFLAATILFWPLPASTVATAVAIFPVHHCHHHHHHHYYYDCKCDDCDDDVVVNVPGLDYCCEKSEMLVPRIKVQSADCPLCLADPILSSPDMLLSDQEMEVTCASLHVITMITLSSSP